jgi:regulator of replication initiation timing
LALSRDELLSLTSAQYEALIAQVRSLRDLTPAEKRDIKNNRRLIKNRESAHASRQRKKDYVKELEKKLADMAQENEKLTKTITAIQNENTLLRSENEYYKTRAQVGSLIPAVVQRGANFLSEQLQQQMPQVQMLQQPQKSPKVSPNKASGVVLMVLLFSFGIMFGNMGFPGNNGQFPMYVIYYSNFLISSQSAVPEVLPRVYEREEFKQVSNTQFDVLSEEAIPSNLMRDRLRKRMAAIDVEEVDSAPASKGTSHRPSSLICKRCCPWPL